MSKIMSDGYDSSRPKHTDRKNSANLSVNGSKISVPLAGVSFSCILPSNQYHVLRADGDVAFCHTPKLQKLSVLSSDLLFVKQELDYLSYVNTVLKLNLEFKKLEELMVAMHYSLDEITSLCIGRQTPIEALQKLKTFFVSLLGRLNDCFVNTNQLFALLEDLEASQQCERVKKRLRLLNCSLFKLPYFKLVAAHLQYMIPKISFLHVFFETSYNEESGSFSVSSLIFSFSALFRSVQKLQLKFRSCSVDYENKVFENVLHGCFLVIKPMLPVNLQIKDEYSSTLFVRELAEQKSVLTAKRICICVLDAFKKEIDIPDSRPNSTNDVLSNTELRSNKPLHLKSKKVAKFLRKEYCKLVTYEKNFFAQIAAEISAIERDSHVEGRVHIYGSKNKYPSTNLPSKIVDWNSGLGPTFNINDIYTEHLWNRVNYIIKNKFLTFLMSFTDHNQSNYLTHQTHSYVLCSCISKLIKDATPTGSIEALAILLLISISLSNLQRWDHGFCRAMGVLLKDKFRYSKENADVPSSLMVNLLLHNQQAQAGIQNYFKFAFEKGIVGYDDKEYSFTTFHGSVCSPMNTFLSYLTATLYFKRQQFLISGNWGQFFVVNSVDFRIITYFLDHVVGSSKENLRSLEQLNVFANYLSNKCRHIKEFEERGFELFFKAIKSRSRNSFDMHMPMGKVWRRRGHNVNHQEANLYVNVIANMIFLPLLDNLNCLAQKKRVGIIHNCIELFVKAWMQFILDNQMMFSWYGANQLRVDFEHFLHWFEQDQFSQMTTDDSRERQSLETLRDMRNAIVLLMCQPHGKQRSQLNYYEETRESMSTISEASVDVFVGDQFDLAIQNIDLHDKERWLALRVKTNQRKLFCLS